MLDGDVAQTGLVGAVGWKVAGGKAQEEGIARVDAAQTVHHHVFDNGPVNAGDGESAAVGVVNEDVAEAEVAEGAAGHGAELDAVGTAAACAVLDKHIL